MHTEGLPRINLQKRDQGMFLVRRIRMTYQDSLLAAFLTGIAVGTAVANLSSNEMKAGLSAFPFSAAGEPGGGGGMFWYLFRCRGAAMAIGWLAGLTSWGAVCFVAAAGYIGMAMAVEISVFTFQKGIAGPLWFGLTLLPHFPLYAVCWAALAVWAGKRPAKLRLPALACLTAAALAGAAAETWGFPALWGLASKFL